MSSRRDDMVRELASRRAWLISDGRAGNDAQSRGVLDAMGVAYDTKAIRPTGLWRLLAPYGPVAPAERLGSKDSVFAPPWPDFIVGAGRQVTPYLRAIRRKAGIATYTVQLLDPRKGTRDADLYWVPSHDTLRGPNVITTITAPHAFSPARLAEARGEAPAWLAAITRPRVAVLVGGPSKAYRFDDGVVRRLMTALMSLEALGAGLMITTSRRTPETLVAALAVFAEAGSHRLYAGSGDNPLRHYFAHADALVVTADSTNMVGEACVTGKPVYVFVPAGGSAKIERFHTALADYGAIRRCPEHFERLETWAYVPLFSAPVIAAAIVERWRRRRDMLSGLL